MPFFSQEWFHDFPDRAHRQLLLNREHLVDHLAAAVASQRTVTFREEVRTMSEQVAETWQDWARRHYTELGREEGEIRALQQTLRKFLERRFGPLPETLLEQIEALRDPDRLQAAILKAAEIASRDELEL